MADRPIIFSAPMVRALLDGRKTQTRRLLNPQPDTFPVDGGECEVAAVHVEGEAVPRVATGRLLTGQKLRYAKGDRLYVREAAWIAPPRWTDSPANPMGPQRQEVAYKADDRSGYTASAAADYKLRLYPSIHMPRWASRLTLTVEDVRVERLQAISEADAQAEGITRIGEEYGAGKVPTSFDEGPNLWSVHMDGFWLNAPTAVGVFQKLWESLHGADSWAANPFVVALTFRVERGNIDTLAKDAA